MLFYIMAYTASGFTLLELISTLAFGHLFGPVFDHGTVVSIWIGIAMSGGLAIVYFLSAQYMRKYDSKIGAVIQTKSKQDLEIAFTALKSFWRLASITVGITITVNYIISELDLPLFFSSPI